MYEHGQGMEDEPTVEFTAPRRRWLRPASAIAAFAAATGVSLAFLVPVPDNASTVAAASDARAATLSPAVIPPLTDEALARPTSSSVTTAESACSGPRSFAAAVARTDPGYTARHGYDHYVVKGCSKGIALAWGVHGDDDATWVALFPTKNGAYDLEEWTTGDPCPSGRSLPATLEEQACADYVPPSAAGSTTPQSTTTTTKMPVVPTSSPTP